MAAFCLGASFGYAVLAETDVPPEGQDWSTRPDGADLSPGAQATDATAPVNPFDDASAMTTLVDQQAEQNTETVAQEVEEMLWPEFGAYNDTYEGLAAFWGDDIISNFFANIGQLLGKWLSELINGWVADAVQLLTGFLRIFVLNPNIAVNGLSSVPGGNGQPVDDISPYVRQGADVMYGIAVDLLLLLFILCIWKYWAEAAWRGGGNLMGAVGRLIFTAGLMLAWPTIYAFEIQITNEMIKTIYFNSADQVAMLDAAMAAAVKGGLVAGAGLLANATAPVAGQVLGGILGGGPGGLVLGTVGSIVAFAGLIIYLILGGVLIAQLVYILVLKAIQTALLTAQYMFAPIFLVFFAVPDTENVTSGFVRSFVEVSLWTFVWVGLLKIMVIIILSDFNPWGKLIVAIGVLQIMIQVPSFLARAQISPMSDFISAGLITGGLLGAGKALGNSLGHRAMHFANAVGNFNYGGAKGAPKSQAAELRGLGNDVMNPELLSGIRETQKTGKVPGQKKGPGDGGIPTDANGQPLKPIDPNAKKPGDPNAKKPGDPNATPGAGKNLNGLGPGLNTKIDPLTGKPIGAGAGDGTGTGAGVGANGANAGLKPATNTGFSGKLDPATGQMVGADGKPLAGGGFGGAVSSFAAGGLMAAANAASLGNPTKTTGDENKTALNGGDPTKGLNPASTAKLNDPNNKVGAQGDKAVKTTVAGGDKNAAANLAPAAAASVTGKVNDKGEGKGAGKSATATDGKGKDLLPGFNAANIGSVMAGMNLGSTPGAKDGSSEVEVEFDKDGNPLNAAVGKGAVTGLNGLKPDSKGGASLAGGNAANQKQTLAAGKTDGGNLSAAQGGGDTKLTAKQPGVSPVNQKSVIPPLASTSLAHFASATATGKVIDPTVALSNGDDTLVSGDPGEPLGSAAKSLQTGSLNKTGAGRTNNGISAKIDPATGQVVSTGGANQLGAQTDAQGKLTAGPAGANRVNAGPNAGANAGANANQFNFGGTAVPATGGGVPMVGMGNAQGANVAGVADFTAEDGNAVSNAPGFNAGNVAGSIARTVAQTAGLQGGKGGVQNAGFSAKIDPVTGKATSVAPNANLNNATADVSGRVVSGPAANNAGNATVPNAGANANQFNFAGSSLPTTGASVGAGMVGLGQTGYTYGLTEVNAEDGSVAGNPAGVGAGAGAPGFNAANIAGSLAQTVAKTGGLPTGGAQNAGFTAKIDPATGKATSVAANANLNNATADVSGRVVSGSGNVAQPGAGVGNVNAGGNANQFNFAGSALPTTAAAAGMTGLGQTGTTNVSGVAEFSAEDGNVASAGAGVGVGVPGFNAANIAGSLAQTVAKTGGLPIGGAQNAGFTAKIDPVTGRATSVAANANLNNATADVSGRVVSGSGNVAQPGVGAGNVNVGGNANQFNFGGSALPTTAGGAGMTGLGQTGTTNVSGVAEFSAEDGNVASNVASAGAGVPGFNAANIAGSLAQSVAQTKGLQTGGAQNAGFTAKIDPVTGKATSVAANANLNNATVDVSGRVVSGSGNVTQPGAGVGNGNVGGNANQFNFGGSAVPTTAGGAGMTGLGQTGATNVSGVAEFSAEDGNVVGNVASAGAGVPGFNAANIAGSLAQSVAQTKGLQTGGAQNAGFTAKIDPVTGKATSVAANANLNNATTDVSGRVVSGSGNVTQPGAGVGNGNANQFNFGGSAVPTTAGGAGMTGLGQTGATNVSGVAEFSAEDGNVASAGAGVGVPGFNAANIAGSLANSVAQTRGMQTGGGQNASFTAKIDPATGKATSVGPAATLGNVDATMRGGVSSSPAASNSAQQPGGQFNFAGSVPNMSNGQVNATNFSGVVEGIGGNDSVTPSAGLNPGSLAATVGQLSSKGNQQQTGATATGASFRATIDNSTGRSTSVNGTPTIDATIQNQAGVGGVASGSPQITSQFTASNAGSGTPNIPPTNTTIGGGDMGGGDGGNGGLNVSGAAATAEGPKASTFANRMQSGYIQVPGRGAAAAMRMAEGGSLMQSDTGVPTNVYDTHGHLMQVRVGQGSSDEQISMQILSGAFGELMSSDAAAYDAARQSAIDAGEHKPQGLAERAASGIMAYNGGSWSQTAAAKQRFARSMAKHASLGAQAYVSGGEGNAYTEYLNNRYGVMDEEQQAWAVHLMTDDSSPESGWSWKNKPASEGLIQSGVGINSASRAVAANNSVMKAQPWLKGAGIRGGVEYMRAMAKDVIPEGTPDGIRDAWYGSVAQDVPAEVANTWGALTLAMGEQVCAQYQTVDTVAAMVGPNGRPEDYVGAYHALKGGEEAVKRVSARYGDSRAVSGGSESVSMSGGSSAGGSQQVVSSGSMQTSVSSTSFGAPANGQADVDFFLDGPQVSAAPINPGSLSVPNLNNPHGGATIANVRMQQGNASSGGGQNTSVRLPGGNVGSSQSQVQIGSVQGGGNGGGNLPDQQVMVDVDTSVSGQVIDPGSVQSAALQSAIGQFGSSGNMVQQVVADLRASGMNWNQIIDANKDDSDPGKYAFLETAVQAYSQNSASMPAVAAAATAVGPSKVSMQDVEIVQNMIDSDPRWDARSIDSSSVYTAKAIVQAHYQEPQTYGQPVLTKDYVDSIRTDPRFIPRPLPVRDSQGSVVRHDQTPVPKDRLMKRILEQALGRDSFGRPRA